MQLNYQQPTIQLAIHHHISEIVNETKNRSQTDISEATWKQNKAIYSQTQFHCYWSLQSPEVMVQNTDQDQQIHGPHGLPEQPKVDIVTFPRPPTILLSPEDEA